MEKKFTLEITDNLEANYHQGVSKRNIINIINIATKTLEDVKALKPMCKRATYLAKIYQINNFSENFLYLSEGNNYPIDTSTGYGKSPCKVCYREEHNIPHGQQYESCKSVHAEQHALQNITRNDTIINGMPTVLFLACNNPNAACLPCKICIKEIIGYKIKYVISVYKIDNVTYIDELLSENIFDHYFEGFTECKYKNIYEINNISSNEKIIYRTKRFYPNI